MSDDKTRPEGPRVAAIVAEEHTRDTTEEVVQYLKQQSLRLVTAESCTAGLIAAGVADVEGAGALLDCAFVTYSPDAKQRCLGVRKEVLDHHNLTSETVAREMALGALRCSPANLAVANTGVTDAVDDRIPAGTQCFAWVFVDEQGRRKVFSETRQFSGDRNAVRQASASYALSRIPSWHTRSAEPVER